MTTKLKIAWRPFFPFAVFSKDVVIPWYFGAAWINWRDDTITCLPVPLNWIAGAIRILWYRLRFPPNRFGLDARAAYHEGFREGLKKGRG